ncbi:MAG: DUF4249 domain-containing protein, partial [Candidatus Symbiothrix sp.]|nr:DUF4249 domain-containing protein [Candidatus Symbiothrix sp.]
MKRILNITLLFIIGMLLANSCMEPITLETNDSPPVIVIYGILTDDYKKQEVKISRSSPYFDDVPNQGVSEANVVVRTSDNLFYRFLEDDSIKGRYCSESKFSVRAGIDYMLTVEVDFDKDGVLDKYEAITTALPSPQIDSLSFEPVNLFRYKNYILYAHIQDSPEKNYYLFNIFRNDSLLTGKLTEWIVADDVLFNGQYVKGDVYLFDDEANSNQSGNQDEERRRTYLRDGDEIKVELGQIPEGYYDFIMQCRSEKSGENPMFGGPSSNIVTNISNGG